MPHPIIAVAMSGGVDSSTVAALLLAEGRRLIGFTMQVWDPRRLPELAAGTRASRVRSGDNIEQARQVARRLGIAHHVVKLQDSFERLVVGPFITEYLKGRTPIPCAVCNRVIKFGELFRLASEAGAERIATGHYARIRRDPATGRYQLLRGVDPAKDQSYFLFGMSQQQLARVLFPLGRRRGNWACQWPARAKARRSASYRMAITRLSSMPTFANRDAPSLIAGVRSSTAKERCWASTPASTGSPSVSAAGLASLPGSRFT